MNFTQTTKTNTRCTYRRRETSIRLCSCARSSTSIPLLSSAIRPILLFLSMHAILLVINQSLSTTTTSISLLQIQRYSSLFVSGETIECDDKNNCVVICERHCDYPPEKDVDSNGDGVPDKDEPTNPPIIDNDDATDGGNGNGGGGTDGGNGGGGGESNQAVAEKGIGFGGILTLASGGILIIVGALLLKRQHNKHARDTDDDRDDDDIVSSFGGVRIVPDITLTSTTGALGNYSTNNNNSMLNHNMSSMNSDLIDVNLHENDV